MRNDFADGLIWAIVVGLIGAAILCIIKDDGMPEHEAEVCAHLGDSKLRVAMGYQVLEVVVSESDYADLKDGDTVTLVGSRMKGCEAMGWRVKRHD